MIVPQSVEQTDARDYSRDKWWQRSLHTVHEIMIATWLFCLKNEWRELVQALH